MDASEIANLYDTAAESAGAVHEPPMYFTDAETIAAYVRLAERLVEYMAERH